MDFDKLVTDRIDFGKYLVSVPFLALWPSLVSRHLCGAIFVWYYESKDTHISFKIFMELYYLLTRLLVGYHKVLVGR
uniref:Uncharacterized protein n=1 Tax=Rhizophora mucronata TaxID=61149 RepID=A0A2P2N3L6_RHIMU